MSQRDRKEYVLWNAVTPIAVTSSTDATPIVVTATTHGLATGDKVQIFGHTTNVAANGIFEVVKVTANTFQLLDINSKASVAGSGAGAGSGGNLIAAPKVVYVGDHKIGILQLGTTGTATLTLKVAGSLGKVSGEPDVPNMGATVAPTNPYTFLQCIDLDTGLALNGATGLVASGADINKQYEVNVNTQKYLAPILASWTQGAITLKLLLTDNL